MDSLVSRDDGVAGAYGCACESAKRSVTDGRRERVRREGVTYLPWVVRRGTPAFGLWLRWVPWVSIGGVTGVFGVVVSLAIVDVLLLGDRTLAVRTVGLAVGRLTLVGTKGEGAWRTRRENGR